MVKKLAFCFLTYDNINKNKLWEKYIKNKLTHCNLYIHNKNDFVDSFMRDYIVENKIETKYGDISLVEASLVLFNEALKDKDNEYFILLSNSCIPLLKFNDLYNYIFTLNNNIVKTSNRFHKERLYSINEKLTIEKHFTKQHQWCCLKRTTVEFFINNKHLIEIFGKKSIIPDEHFFITFIKKYNINYNDQLMTYVDWRKNIKTNFIFYNWRKVNKESNSHPKTFQKLTNKEVFLIRKFYPNTLFMRKIAKNCQLPSYFDTLIE